MKIALGADHGGVDLKDAIKRYLEEHNYEVEDFGTYSHESVDYPNYAKLVAQAVQTGQCQQGILVCGTGIGMSIAANKIDGIRCALVHDVFSAKATREHNNTNVLAMGARVIGEGLALMIVETWLHTMYEGGRHDHRLQLIEEMEGCK